MQWYIVMASDSHLVVCETFYSIQGEGKTSGVPAVFLRLAGCNLQCSGFSYREPSTQEHLGCDSKQLWRHGVRMSFSDIINSWQERDWLSVLIRGAHLVITGGEPLLQQKALVCFIAELDKVLENKVFCEIETNATLLADHRLLKRINQFNVSPKLRHSGELAAKAYKRAVLEQFAVCDKAIFKFVMANPDDMTEVLDNYLYPFAINRQRVWLMPEGGEQAVINEKKPWLVELCKEQGCNFSSRLQIDIWGEVVGV